MRSREKLYRAAALGAILLMAAGCRDRLPTLSGVERYPGGGLPTTLQLVVGTDEFLLEAETFRGPTGVQEATSLLVARNFDGALNAHSLARLRGFPDTVIVGEVRTGSFAYEESRVYVQITDTVSATPSDLSLQLWTVTQAWDSTSVTWDNAVDRPDQRVPWQTPGGARGELVATTRWVRGAAGVVDTVSWQVPGEVVRGLAAQEFPGLMVMMETNGSRVEIGRLALEAKIRVPQVADTVITQRVTQGHQTYVFTPGPPQPDPVLSIGGLTSDRALLRIRVGALLPGCPPGIGANCPPISPMDVSLNRIELVLDPVPVPSGFRPTGPTEIRVRRLLEPELGRRAPLGALVAIDSVPSARFTPEGAQPVSFVITAAVAAALARGDTELGLSILIEPEAAEFSYAWFSRNPRLRFVYTLPQPPQLP